MALAVFLSSCMARRGVGRQMPDRAPFTGTTADRALFAFRRRECYAGENVSECKRRATVPESRRLLWIRSKRDAISLFSSEETLSVARIVLTRSPLSREFLQGNVRQLSTVCLRAGHDSRPGCPGRKTGPRARRRPGTGRRECTGLCGAKKTVSAKKTTVSPPPSHVRSGGFSDVLASL